jgi:glutaconate CoA-transferase subunit A
LSEERKSKVKSPEEAFAAIKDGTLLSMTATHYNSVPMAAMRQVIRQGTKDLAIVPTPSAGLAIDLLIAAGSASTVYASYVGMEFIGLAPNFRRAAENHEITIIDVDESALVMGYKAGAAGIPFMAMPLFYGLTDLPKVSPQIYKEITDPFTGNKCFAVPAIIPDVAVIHVQECDAYGNARQLGGNHMENVIAKSANHVIITTEAVRPLAETQKDPTRTTIPGMIVDSVVELPFGAHPGACPTRYNYDEPHLRDYAALGKAGRTQDYIDEYVLGPADHGAYLDKIGAGRLMELRTSF